MSNEFEAAPTPVRVGPAVLAYVVSLVGALYVWRTFRPEGLWLALTVAVPLAALGWMFRQALLRRRQGNCTSPAVRAYLRRFVPMMIGYVTLLALAIWATDRFQPSGAAAFALAILPALPLVGVVWAMGRLLIEESDEYLRLLHVRQILVATGFALAVACVLGFLDQFGQIPHIPMYWTFIIWCAGLGLGAFVNERRA